MEEKRKVQDKDRVKHNILNRDIKKRCMEAKEEWLNNQCKEIEESKSTTSIHKKTLNISGKRKERTSCTSCINSTEGNLLMEEKEACERWEEYIEELYHDDRG